MTTRSGYGHRDYLTEGEHLTGACTEGNEEALRLAGVVDGQREAKVLVSATESLPEADLKGGAPSKLMPAFYAGAFLIFASLLYIRPYLWASSSTPYKELKDPFHNAYWLCLYFSCFRVLSYTCR